MLCAIFESAQFAKCAAQFAMVRSRVRLWLEFGSRLGSASGLGLWLELWSGLGEAFANCICVILKLHSACCKLHSLTNRAQRNMKGYKTELSGCAPKIFDIDIFV